MNKKNVLWSSDRKTNAKQGTIMDIQNNKRMAIEENEFNANLNYIHYQMIDYMMDVNSRGNLNWQELDIIKAGSVCFTGL
jgi:hypothetical protein